MDKSRMGEQRTIRECLLGVYESNEGFVNDLLSVIPRKKEVHQLSESEMALIVNKILSIYYESENQERRYLDWVSALMNQYKTKQQINKQLGNNLVMILLNSYAHHFLYHQDEESMHQSLQNITAYADSDIPADIILLAIGVNNKSVLEMTNRNYLSAYKLSYLIVERLEEHIEEKRMKKSKLIEEDVVVLVNTYLIVCQALHAHLKSQEVWGQLEYQYEIDLAHTYVKGVKMSEFYLGEESVITQAFKVMDDIQPVSDIPVVKVTLPTDDSSSPSQMKMDGILRMLETRIEHIEEIFIADKPEQPQLPSISAILPKKISEMSVNPSNKQIKKDIQFIKQINSFDDIPLNPTISNQIPVSPVYSSVAPVEFPAFKKSPVSTPPVVTPITPQYLEPIGKGFSEVVQKVQDIPEPAVKTPTIIEKIVELEIDSENRVELLDKLFQFTFPKFLSDEMTLILRLYQDNKLQIVLMKHDKQIDCRILQQQQIQKFTQKTHSAPFILSPTNIYIQQKILFFILPYCDVTNQKLCFLPFPRSVIPPEKITFLGEEVNIIVVFVQLNEFRVILTVFENNQKEYFSYEFYISEEEADDKILNYVESMETHHRVKNLFNRYNRFKINSDPVSMSVYYPAFRRLERFVDEVKQSVALVQEFINNQQLHNRFRSVLFVYTLNQFKERSSINAIYEQNDGYTILLENHLKFPQQTIKLKDKATYSYEEEREDLGDLLPDATQTERNYLRAIVCDRHRLRKIRKDFVEEDYRLYSRHPSDGAGRFLYIGCKRIISYDPENPEYWITTITLVCNIDNSPLGIKVNIYFPQHTRSSNLFIPMSRYIWVKERKTSESNQSKFKITQAEKRRLKKKVFLNEFPVVTNYNISNIMTRGGFQEIIDILDIKDGKVTNKQFRAIRLQNLVFDNIY